jgi:pyruvate formate-lyase activating enzyme-like uncharacterized protein
MYIEAFHSLPTGGVVCQRGTTVVIAITKQLNEQNCYLSGI